MSKAKKTAAPPAAPTLLGLTNKTNREKGKKSFWGKNEFNSAFPTALLCYMATKKIKPIYITLNKKLKIVHKLIPVKDLFMINPFSSEIKFSFEDVFSPLQPFVKGGIPRNDLVVIKNGTPPQPLCGFEMKLTALPDNSTAKLSEDEFSCEMVFRQPSIVHLAISIANQYKDDRGALLAKLSPVCSQIFNWRSSVEVLPHVDGLIQAFDDIFKDIVDKQIPLIIHPIWKSVGTTSVLDDNCLDVFVWSNLAFTRLFVDSCTKQSAKKKSAKKGTKRSIPKMTRQQRCVLWLARMLHDFAQGGQIDPSLIPSEMAYKLQTDKAFSISGVRSRSYFQKDILKKPRVTSKELGKIILNGGEAKLSPERRFDAAIVNSKGLVENE